MATEKKNIQVRTGTRAQWDASNHVLGAGEVGFISDDAAGGALVVGDGATAFSGIGSKFYPRADTAAVSFATVADAMIGETYAATTMWIGTKLYRLSAAGQDFTTIDGRTWYHDSDGGRTFDAKDYIPSDQMVHILNNDIDSQDASVVSAALQEMHEAAIDFVVAGGSASYAAVMRYGGGKFAVNDEAFSETFAQKLHDLNAPTGSVTLFTFDFTGSVFQCKGWPSHKTKRSSGVWLAEGKTDEWLPSSFFRWEQPSKRGYGPVIIGGTFVGESKTTDPMPFFTKRLNLHAQSGVVCKDFANTGRFIDDMNNSDFVDDEFATCGWQPTACGGSGFVSKTATVSTTGSGGTTAVLASEDIFLPEHVGEYLQISDGSPDGGISFGSVIQSYTDARNVVLADECPDDVVDANISFIMICGSTTAGSNILTLKKPVSHDLEGRYVHVYKAGSEKFDDRDLLVCRVLDHSGTTLTLSATAGNTTVDTPICVAPTVFTGKTEDGSVTSNINDVTFHGSRIVHQIFDSDFGGSVTEVATDWFRVFTYGRKLHGTPANWNNFGGNASALWADNCKVVNAHSAMFEWGQWHPDLGKMSFTGARCEYNIDGICMGGVNTAWRQAYFLIDPMGADNPDFQVYFSGHINSKPGQTDGPHQEFVRFGTHGKEVMLLSDGPVKSRNKNGFPDMRPTPVRKLFVFTEDPADGMSYYNPETDEETPFFETGDWDITFEDETGNISATTATGSYTKWADGRVDLYAPKIGPIDVTGMVGTEDFKIILPFACGTPQRAIVGIDMSGAAAKNGSGSQLSGRIENTKDYIALHNVGITSASSIQRVQDVDGGTIQAMSGSYKT